MAVTVEHLLGIVKKKKCFIALNLLQNAETKNHYVTSRPGEA